MFGKKQRRIDHLVGVCDKLAHEKVNKTRRIADLESENRELWEYVDVLGPLVTVASETAQKMRELEGTHSRLRRRQRERSSEVIAGLTEDALRRHDETERAIADGTHPHAEQIERHRARAREQAESDGGA